MSIEEIRVALKESHSSDLEVIKRYIAWVGFRRRMHTLFYFRAHWIKPNPKPFPSLTPLTLPTTHERRKAYRVNFNAHWMNG